MHSLETIKALNERAVQQCESCKKYHVEYPGKEVLVSEYLITAAGEEGKPAVEMQRKLCLVCLAVVTAATTDFTVQKVA